MDLNTQAGMRTDVFTPDRLIADDADDIIGKGITLAAGQSLARGAILGKITATGKYALCTSGATDGSQTPTVILAQDCDANAGDAAAIAYFQGTFNGAALIYDSTVPLQTIKDTLRGLSIMIVDTIGGV